MSTPTPAKDRNIILVKIGGSSITCKDQFETLDDEALDWFTNSIARAVHERYLAPELTNSTGSDDNICFVLVHGAGSFGHFSAKKYGLRGHDKHPKATAPPSISEDRTTKRGLAETRLSVQTLNHAVVSSLLKKGVNAVAISPAFGIPGLEAHANLQPTVRTHLEKTVLQAVEAGVVPVLHGDACLYGTGAGILSGDTLLEILGSCDWIHGSIFITDVDGVFDSDPRSNPSATLLRTIHVDSKAQLVTTNLNASNSSHEHDVTGGLETKLKSAAQIAAAGKDVLIVKCGSTSAEHALEGKMDVATGTTISLLP